MDNDDRAPPLQAGNKLTTPRPTRGSWKKGQSGNPSGLTVAARKKRQAVADMLDEAFYDPATGRDLLVEAIKAGVIQGDASLTRLAAEYRWCKAPQPIEGALAVGSATTEQLIEQIPEALQVLQGGK